MFLSSSIRLMSTGCVVKRDWSGFRDRVHVQFGVAIIMSAIRTVCQSGYERVDHVSNESYGRITEGR